jgi:hypothetical protein
MKPGEFDEVMNAFNEQFNSLSERINSISEKINSMPEPKDYSTEINSLRNDMFDALKSFTPSHTEIVDEPAKETEITINDILGI